MTLIVNRKGMNRLLYATVFFMFIMGFLIHDIGLPIGIMALLDFAVVFALAFSLRFASNYMQRANAGALITICAVLLIVGVVHGALSNVPIKTLVEGVRNSFRGMVTFIVAVCLLHKGTVDRILRLTERFFQTNVVVCTIQFFVFGVKQDYCNGLFGAGVMNSWTNILICAMAAYYISQYMHRVTSFRKAMINIVLCMYVAMLAELKVFFFELVFILMALIMLQKPSLRILVICLLGGVALIGMLTVFTNFWGDNFLFTIDGMKYYLEMNRDYGYSAVGDWGRIGGITNATKKFFRNDLNLFGMGLGYCGYDTPFYFRYGWLHYNWFSYISIFLEQGWVGFAGYIAFFVINAIQLWKRKKMSRSWNAKVIYDLSMIMSLLGIVLMIYNSTLTGYPAFFLYLLMALAYRCEQSDAASPSGRTTVRYRHFAEQAHQYAVNLIPCNDL